MINMSFLWGAIAIMLIIIMRSVLKKYFNIDMDKIDVVSVFNSIVSNFSKKKSKICIITRDTGSKNLILASSGKNKATVLATLRQITGINYENAKNIVESTPAAFMRNVSEQEADMTQKALEFVGAKVEIK